MRLLGKMAQSVRMTQEQYDNYCFRLKEKSIITKENCSEKKLTKTRTKYNASITTRNGRKFDSKLEAKYFDYLTLRQKANDIKFFLSQVPIHLPGNVKYVCDFLVFHNDGTYSFIDVKGFKTSMFILKKKQVESLYPIKINMVDSKKLITLL